MGYRKGTRYMFKRQFRHKGVIALSQYLQPLKVRDSFRYAFCALRSVAVRAASTACRPRRRGQTLTRARAGTLAPLA